jgi:ribonuclease J
VQVKPLHTSGHADVGALKEFKEAIAPRELVPIHTEHPELFGELFG